MQLQVAIDNDTTTLELKFYNVSTPTPQSLAMSELVFFAQLARIYKTSGYTLESYTARFT